MGNSKSKAKEIYTELIRESIIGYKALSPDFTCRGFKYEVGETYEMPPNEKIKLGKCGFHFCRLPEDCQKYYPLNEETRYARIEAWESVHSINNSVAQKIRIIEELSFEQFTHLSGIFTTTDRTIHRKNGICHRDGDLPAIEYTNGDLEYRIDGRLHREGDKPARVFANGNVEYHIDGKLHREGDKPARVFANGHVEYWIDNELHRDGDQPAIVKVNGEKEYYHKNKKHRVGGPAIIKADGTLIYYENNQLHCLDGPAIRYPNGDYEYYVHNNRHNKTGPAIKKTKGRKIELRWFVNGVEYELDTKEREFADPSLIWIDRKCYAKKPRCYEDWEGYGYDY